MQSLPEEGYEEVCLETLLQNKLKRNKILSVNSQSPMHMQKDLVSYIDLKEREIIKRQLQME